MGYIYGGMWLVIALLLFTKMSKENKIFYFLGGYFTLLGLWWLADTAMPGLGLFKGTWDIVLKVISAITLAITAIFYYKNYMKDRNK